jgi:hypothetical protein
MCLLASGKKGPALKGAVRMASAKPWERADQINLWGPLRKRA